VRTEEYPRREGGRFSAPTDAVGTMLGTPLDGRSVPDDLV
jgi:hypothetical protein